MTAKPKPASPQNPKPLRAFGPQTPFGPRPCNVTSLFLIIYSKQSTIYPEIWLEPRRGFECRVQSARTSVYHYYSYIISWLLSFIPFSPIIFLLKASLFFYQSPLDYHFGTRCLDFFVYSRGSAHDPLDSVQTCGGLCLPDLPGLLLDPVPLWSRRCFVNIFKTPTNCLPKLLIL